MPPILWRIQIVKMYNKRVMSNQVVSTVFFLTRIKSIGSSGIMEWGGKDSLGGAGLLMEAMTSIGPLQSVIPEVAMWGTRR